MVAMSSSKRSRPSSRSKSSDTSAALFYSSTMGDFPAAFSLSKPYSSLALDLGKDSYFQVSGFARIVQGKTHAGVELITSLIVQGRVVVSLKMKAPSAIPVGDLQRLLRMGDSSSQSAAGLASSTTRNSRSR